MIRLWFLLAVFVLYLIFVVYNQEEKISLHYPLGLSTPPLPIHLVILGAVIAGLLLSLFLALPPWLQLKGQIRRQRRAIQDMEAELDRLLPDRPEEPQETYGRGEYDKET